MVVEHGHPRVSERIVVLLVPLVVEENFKVVKAVLQEQISERICKQIMDAHVSQVVEQVAGVLKTSSRDRTVQYTVQVIEFLRIKDNHENHFYVLPSLV